MSTRKHSAFRICRSFQHCKLTGLVVLMLMFAVSVPTAQAQGFRDLQLKTESDENTNDSQRARLSRVVLPNRNANRKLKALSQSLADGNYGAAADALNQIGTDHLSDSLYWNDKGKLTNVMREARQVFGAAGQKAMEAFETRFGVEANNALKDVDETRGFEPLADVGRRYFFSAAGFTALESYATVMLDRGCPAEAAIILQDLVRSPAHRSRITSRLLQKTAAALKKSGQDADAVAFLKNAQKDFPFDEAQWQRIHQALQTISANRQFRSSDWLTPFGDAQNALIANGSVPYLTPKWSRSLSPETSDSASRRIQMLTMHTEQTPNGIDSELQNYSAMPLIVNGQVLASDSLGVIGINLATGRGSWRYRAPKSAYELALKQSNEFVAAGVIRYRHRKFDTDLLGDTDFQSHPVNGLISSDGVRVFAMNYLGIRSDEIPLPRHIGEDPPAQDPEPDPLDDEMAANRQWINQLVCLRIPEGSALTASNEIEVTADWVLGANSGRADDPLAKHTFLGSPLPVGDALYVMTEYRNEVNLVRLQAATGQVLRMTRLCSSATLLNRVAPNRASVSAYVPVAANGLVICPTEAGILIAVDTLFGEIQWMYALTDGANMHGERIPSTCFLDAPHVWQDSLIYMPSGTSDVHCLDWKTGTRRWQTVSPDVESVGVVTDDVVVLVGREVAIGLKRSDGSGLWRTKLGVVSGRGVAIDSTFVMPLQSGGTAKIEIKTGRLIGSEHSLLGQTEGAIDIEQVTGVPNREFQQFGFSTKVMKPEQRLGNLVAQGDSVISMNSQYLTVFRQAHAVQKELVDSNAPRDQLVLADIELTLGNVAASKARIEKVSVASRSKSAPISETLVRSTLRESILVALNAASPKTGTADRFELIDQLHALSANSAERAQALAWRLKGGSESNTRLSFGLASRELARMGNEFVELQPAERHVARSSAIAQRGMQQALQAKEGIERDRLVKYVQSDLIEARQDGSLESLSRVVNLYPSWPESAAIRNQLAARLIEANRLHEAEHMLQSNLQIEDSEQLAVSLLLTAHLLATADLYGEAARTLERLEREFADVQINLEDRFVESALKHWFDVRALEQRHASRVADWVTNLIPKTRLAEVVRQRQPLSWTVNLVRISNKSMPGSRSDLSEIHHRARRKELALGSDVDVLTRYEDGEQSWSFCDRLLGIERGHIPLPAQVDDDLRNLKRQTGHVISVGTVGYLNGISLLETNRDEPIWKLAFAPAISRGELIETGPTTGRTSFFYSSRHLLAVDSATGKVRWRRSDLTLPVGLAGDMRQFMHADEIVLTIFEPDGSTYVALSTITGEILRKGKLKVDDNISPPLPLGRRLGYVSTPDSKGKRQFRIWDPVTNRDDLAEPFNEDDQVPQSTPDGRIVILKKDGRLRVFVANQIEPELDVMIPLDSTDANAAPYFFMDGDLAFLNLRRDKQSQFGRKYSPDIDAALSTETLGAGNLVAIDRSQQKVVWKRAIRSRVLVRIDSGRLPFLVTAAMVHSPKTEESMEIEAIDRATGFVIGQKRNAIPCRLVHTELDRDSGRLSLFGLSRRKQNDANGFQTVYGSVNRIDLEFAPPNRNFAESPSNKPRG